MSTHDDGTNPRRLTDEALRELLVSYSLWDQMQPDSPLNINLPSGADIAIAMGPIGFKDASKGFGLKIAGILGMGKDPDAAQTRGEFLMGIFGNAADPDPSLMDGVGEVEVTYYRDGDRYVIVGAEAAESVLNTTVAEARRQFAMTSAELKAKDNVNSEPAPNSPGSNIG